MLCSFRWLEARFVYILTFLVRYLLTYQLTDSLTVLT